MTLRNCVRTLAGRCAVAATIGLLCCARPTLADDEDQVTVSLITTVVGTGEAGYEGDGGPAASAMLNEPTHLALGPDGALYISDTGNHCIRKVGTDGDISTVAGTGTEGFSGDGGPAVDAELNRPLGLAVSPQGELYIADHDNNRIRRVAADGTIETVAGTGEEGYAGDGGPATEARLNEPGELALSGEGTLVFASSDMRVRQIKHDGTIHLLVGNGQEDRFPMDQEDHLATEVPLGELTGLAVDEEGVVFLLSTFFGVFTGNGDELLRVDRAGRIQKLSSETVKQVPALPVGRWGESTNGFMNLNAVSVGPNGTLYVSERGFICRFADGAASMCPGGAGDTPCSDLAVLAEGDLYIAHADKHIVRRVSRQQTPGRVHVESHRTEISLEWSLPDDFDVQEFRVYREWHHQPIEIVKEPRFVDGGLSDGTTYRYRIVGVIEDGKTWIEFPVVTATAGAAAHTDRQGVVESRGRGLLDLAARD